MWSAAPPPHAARGPPPQEDEPANILAAHCRLRATPLPGATAAAAADLSPMDGPAAAMASPRRRQAFQNAKKGMSGQAVPGRVPGTGVSDPTRTAEPRAPTPWTPGEESSLEEMVLQNGAFGWSEKAAELGTGRSANAVQKHWHAMVKDNAELAAVPPKAPAPKGALFAEESVAEAAAEAADGSSGNIIMQQLQRWQQRQQMN